MLLQNKFYLFIIGILLGVKQCFCSKEINEKKNSTILICIIKFNLRLAFWGQNLNLRISPLPKLIVHDPPLLSYFQLGFPTDR